MCAEHTAISITMPAKALQPKCLQASWSQTVLYSACGVAGSAYMYIGSLVAYAMTLARGAFLAFTVSDRNAFTCAAQQQIQTQLLSA